MAGAAPESVADDLASAEEEAPSWSSSRAHTALVQVLLLVPLDVRARAARVCRTWRDAAADPALFAALWFDKSSTGKLDDAALLRLCVLAGAALRELRLDSRGAPACKPPLCSAAGVIAALRAGGCAGVQRLTLPNPAWTLYDRDERDRLRAEQVPELVACCPALELVACAVGCESSEDVATACACLPSPLALFVVGSSVYEPKSTFADDAARAALLLPAQMAELAIKRCSLYDASVAGLREALRANATLTCLTLDHNGLGDAGAVALSEALRTNAALTRLNLYDNYIRDSGAAALGEALRTNATLTTLDLAHNEISDEGAAAFGEALRTNATLKVLRLDCNHIENAGAVALANALHTNATLTTLYLKSNRIGDAGYAALREVLRTNATLTTLDLAYN